MAGNKNALFVGKGREVVEEPCLMGLFLRQGEEFLLRGFHCVLEKSSNVSMRPSKTGSFPTGRGENTTVGKTWEDFKSDLESHRLTNWLHEAKRTPMCGYFSGSS